MISSGTSSDLSTERIRLEALHPEKWKNPKPAEQYDLVIVGGGPAGVTAADEAARRHAKVALIESNRLGGNCLNTGCIPSKTIIRTSRLYAEMRNAEDSKSPSILPPPWNMCVRFARASHARLRPKAWLPMAWICFSPRQGLPDPIAWPWTPISCGSKKR